MLPVGDRTASTNGQDTNGNPEPSFFDQFVSRMTEAWNNISINLPETKPVTSLIDFEEDNPWNYDVFERVFLHLDPGGFNALFVCKGWARDGFDLLIKIQRARTAKWVATLPQDKPLLLQFTEKTPKNLKEFLKLQHSDKDAIHAQLQTYSLDQLQTIQASARQQSLPSDEQEIISLVIIKKAEELISKGNWDNHQAYRNDFNRAKKIITEQWTFLLNIKRTSAAVTVMNQQNTFLPDEYSRIMGEHISKIDDLEVLLNLTTQIKSFRCRDPGLIHLVQLEILGCIYRRFVNLRQLDIAIPHAQKNGDLVCLCLALVKRMSLDKEIKKQDFKTVVKLFPNIPSSERINIQLWMKANLILNADEIDAIIQEAQ